MVKRLGPGYHSRLQAEEGLEIRFALKKYRLTGRTIKEKMPYDLPSRRSSSDGYPTLSPASENLRS